MTDMIQTATLAVLAVAVLANSISIARHNRALGDLSAAIRALSEPRL